MPRIALKDSISSAQTALCRPDSHLPSYVDVLGTARCGAATQGATLHQGSPRAQWSLQADHLRGRIPEGTSRARADPAPGVSAECIPGATPRDVEKSYIVQHRLVGRVHGTCVLPGARSLCSASRMQVAVRGRSRRRVCRPVCSGCAASGYGGSRDAMRARVGSRCVCARDGGHAPAGMPSGRGLTMGACVRTNGITRRATSVGADASAKGRTDGEASPDCEASPMP